MANETKTPQEQIADLQNQVVELTERATLAEARQKELERDNATLQKTNQELFIRATNVSAGRSPDYDPETPPAKSLSETAREYFASKRK